MCKTILELILKFETLIFLLNLNEKLLFEEKFNLSIPRFFKSFLRIRVNKLKLLDSLKLEKSPSNKKKLSLFLIFIFLEESFTFSYSSFIFSNKYFLSLI